METPTRPETVHSFLSTAEKVKEEAKRIQESREPRGNDSGWEEYLIGESPLCDTWLRKAPAGTSIGPQRHFEHRRFICLLSGEMRVTIEGKETLLSSNETSQKTIYVPSGAVFSAEIIREVVSVHIFQPPIGR